SPSDIVSGQVRADEAFRLGGMVEDKSIKRQGEKISFRVTDKVNTVTVEYQGILPDLFREGQGVVAEGHMNNKNIFIADKILAKHDQYYMPPEAADALERAEKNK